MTSSYSHCSSCGSWVVDCKFVGCEFLGCALWCWVVGGYFGFWVGVIWCWVAVLPWCWFFGSTMERQRRRWETDVIWCWLFRRDMVFGFGDGETEMRDVSPWYGFWVRQWRDKDERWETEERESDKILLFFYNTCYSAILCLELHCSSIAKKFAILLFSILQCRWFWGLKFQISLRFGISIHQC